MCGRYVAAATDGELMGFYGDLYPLPNQPPPSWNVAPTDPARVILERLGEDEPRRELTTLSWGLVPSWSKSKKTGAKMINARVETVLEKPSFRTAASKRRCIVPAAGYYEWQNSETGKTPYFLHADTPLLSFAGLYEWWPDPSKADDDPDRWHGTFTIITTTATDETGWIHDRSPLILPDDLVEEWLDPTTSALPDVQHLINLVPQPALVPRQVSTQVNSVRNDGPELISAVN